MRIYVYGCANHEHPRVEVSHKMDENPDIYCRVCNSRMHRVPQLPAAIGFNSQEILVSWMEENYRRHRAGRPKFSPDLVKRPDKPIPLGRRR